MSVVRRRSLPEASLRSEFIATAPPAGVAIDVVPSNSQSSTLSLLATAPKLPIELCPGALFLRSGRLSIYHVLQTLRKTSRRAEVLLPAYHCDSMVEACQWAGLNVQFYKMTGQLEPQIEDLAGKLSDRTLAVVFVHYFGFDTPLDDIAELCREYGTQIIEDAAHCELACDVQRGTIGSFGDWAIGSLRKFYPVYDGAFLIPLSSAAREITISSPKRMASAEARSFKHTVQQLLGHKRTSHVKTDESHPEDPDSQIRRTAKSTNEAEDYVDCRFSPSANSAMTLSSRHVLRRIASVDKNDTRRRNYREIASVVADASRARLLYAKLPDGVIPYAVPALLVKPDEDHQRIRSSGILVYRWEDLQSDICDVSRRYEQQLIQIPCHQSLSAAQLQHICDVLKRILH